jgi:hypothetical protein
MFGGGAPSEDMFAKLDQMKEVITEVNTQFKDPVSRTLVHPTVLLKVIRKRRHSSVSASPSSFPFTKPSA